MEELAVNRMYMFAHHGVPCAVVHAVAGVHVAADVATLWHVASSMHLWLIALFPVFGNCVRVTGLGLTLNPEVSW